MKYITLISALLAAMLIVASFAQKNMLASPQAPQAPTPQTPEQRRQAAIDRQWDFREVADGNG